MARFSNVLIVLASAIFCIGYSGPASAQEFQDDAPGGIGVSGYGVAGIVWGVTGRGNRWQWYREWRRDYQGPTGKGRPQNIEEESASLIDLMNVTIKLAEEKKYNEALVSLRKFEAMGGKEPEAVFFIQRMRASIAYESGKEELFAKSLEAAIATNQASAEEQLQFIQIMSSLYARQKDLPKTIAWTSRYLKEGGTEPGMRVRLFRAHYLNNDFAEAARELRESIAADQAAGKTPAQEDLGLLASAELKAGKVEK